MIGETGERKSAVATPDGKSRKKKKKKLNEENPRSIFDDGVPNEWLTQGISRDEVKVAVSRMKNGKATGMDGIPVEVWKCLGEEGIDMLWDLMQGIYEQETIPTEWRDSVIIPIYKEKGDIQDCENYRGIKLMSHTMKIWERIIDRRLREETTIGDEQFGFMPGRGTTDAIFAVRQLMEKHREKQKGLHMVFRPYRPGKGVRWSASSRSMEMHEGEGSA